MKKEIRKVRPPRKTSAGSLKADESLRAYMASVKTAIDPRFAIAEALSVTTDRVSINIDEDRAATITPGNLLQLTFASPSVALDKQQMLVFLRNLAALFDSRTGARILHNIGPDPGQRIGLVSELIGLWQADPEA